jgi:hypothetical protein
VTVSPAAPDAAATHWQRTSTKTQTLESVWLSRLGVAVRDCGQGSLAVTALRRSWCTEETLGEILTLTDTATTRMTGLALWVFEEFDLSRSVSTAAYLGTIVGGQVLTRVDQMISDGLTYSDAFAWARVIAGRVESQGMFEALQMWEKEFSARRRWDATGLPGEVCALAWASGLAVEEVVASAEAGTLSLPTLRGLAALRGYLL